MQSDTHSSFSPHDPDAVGGPATADLVDAENEKQGDLVKEIGRVDSNSTQSLKSPSGNASPGSNRLFQSPGMQKFLHVLDPESTWSSEEKSEQSQGRKWRTTLIRFGPLSGIFCMLLAVGMIFASLGILAGSNHQATAEWTVPPSTYLAIFTAIANLSMRYAAFQGVVITWWVRAGRGSTLANLHWNWRAGTLRGALTAGTHMGLIGIACIMSTIVVIDGPLLQRSSTVVLASYVDRPVPLKVNLAPEVPTDYTGTWATSWELGLNGSIQNIAFNRTYPTPNGRAPNFIYGSYNAEFAINVTREWYNEAPLQGVVSGCPSICTAKVKAPALAIKECSSEIIPVNYSTPVPPHPGPEGGHWGSAAPLSSVGYMVATGLRINETEEIIEVITGYATMSSPEECTGTLNLTTCALRSAVAEYNVRLEKNKATMEAVSSPRIIALANNSQVNPVLRAKALGHASTLAGVWSLMKAQWDGEVTFYPVDGTVTGLSNGCGGFERYLKPGSQGCAASWEDPTQDVLADFNRLMVYTGALAATDHRRPLEANMDPGLVARSDITGYLEGLHDVYHTDYYYFLGAVLVELVCVALVLPTYWGWWTIGRPCSFSPLELAKAFQSPMLAECNSNSSGRDLAKTVGRVCVKYGVIPTSDSDVERQRLAFGAAESVTRPSKGMRFDA